MPRMLSSAVRAFAVLAAMVVACAAPARAEWPERAITIIVPFPPGGPNDLLGRLLAAELGKKFNQTVIVENKAGAVGDIGITAGARAAPDGYTLVEVTGVVLINPSVRKTAYDPVKSFDPVGRVGDVVCGFVIHPSVGVKTLKEMIEYAKKNPGKLTFASSGNGTANHLRVEMLKLKTGIDILHVPYRGSADALNDLLPNNVQMMNEINVLPHVKAGKLILLSINHPKRSPEFPDTPTLTECGYPNSDMISWYAIWAPIGTPPEIIQKFNAAIAKIGSGADMKKKLQTISAVEVVDKPEDTAKFLAEEIQRNAELIKAANIKLE